MIEPARSEVSIREAMFRRWPALLLHYAARPLGYFEFTDIYWIDPRAQLPQRALQGYLIEHATDDDIDYICRILTRDQPSHVVRGRWRDGHHCFVARFEGKVVAYDWIAFSAVQEQEYSIQLQSSDAFCLDAYTVREPRGKGVHYALLRALLEYAAQSGKTRAFTAVSLFNVNSWKSHLRMGWVRLCTVGYFRPYFTRSRLPWQFTQTVYPVQLDWRRHAWERK
jgi:GNAT superfamily N-acetyltransferase